MITDVSTMLLQDISRGSMVLAEDVACVLMPKKKKEPKLQESTGKCYEHEPMSYFLSNYHDCTAQC
jgi:hypothetical protein